MFRSCAQQGYIHNCVVKGRETSVGFVESMLLLSENLPRQEEKDAVVLATDTKTWDDSTQSWFFVGHAVRTGYLLGLDQVRCQRNPCRLLCLMRPLFLPSQQTLYIDPSAPTTPQIDRERLAWTYCYLFDRHVSLVRPSYVCSRLTTSCLPVYRYPSESARLSGRAAQVCVSRQTTHIPTFPPSGQYRAHKTT